ncbi:hypothetical protein DPMN_143294 [Dreissena polymorpha]|uniref:Uncharacterized protein n=1 Tax=Dreissena polymorpha TaxID=45954 RepID=A0A9D4GG40_DREPO|nr:hypothetical protein DPMN_143294 [Dreissena polymorpha]
MRSLQIHSIKDLSSIAPKPSTRLWPPCGQAGRQSYVSALSQLPILQHGVNNLDSSRHN